MRPTASTPTPRTADAVAADADGDYVVAWTDTTPGHQGVWAKMYQQTSTLNADGIAHARPIRHRACDNEILISVRSHGQRHLRRPRRRRRLRRHLVGLERDHRLGRVCPAVRRRRPKRWEASSASTRLPPTCTAYSVRGDGRPGDFVITWQSQNQDGSGYGIYAQAYNAAGNPVGGVDEIQAIDFTSGFTGTFRLRWDDDNNPATPDKVTAADHVSAATPRPRSPPFKMRLAAIGANVNVVCQRRLRGIGSVHRRQRQRGQQPLWISSGDVVKTGGSRRCAGNDQDH